MGSSKYSKLLDKLREDQLLKKDSDPWSWRYISIRLCRPKEGNDLVCSCLILSLHSSFISSPLSLFLYFLIFLFRCICSVCSYSGCERRQIVAADVSKCVSVSWLYVKSKAHVSTCCHLFTNMSHPYMSLPEEMEVLKFVFS